MLRNFAPMALIPCDSVSLNLASVVRGTMVATPRGEVPVETLNAGDLVTDIDDDGALARPILWSGRGMQQAAGDAALLVRVRAGALRPGVPASDLLLTESQCVFTDDGCIAGHMLANGVSIVVERPAAPYQCFYLAFARQSNLLLNGLLSRSNISIGKHTAGVRLAEAELKHDGKVLRPFWRRLARRDAGMDCPGRSSGHVVDDSCLRLLLDGGQEVSPGSVSEGRFVFHIPRSSRPLAILSPVRRQSGDDRLLGAAVEGLVYQGRRFSYQFEADALDLDGWYGLDEGFRWTNGRAKVDMLPQAADHATYLTVRLRTNPAFATHPAAMPLLDTIQNA